MLKSIRRLFGRTQAPKTDAPAPVPKPEEPTILKIEDGRVQMPESIETLNELSFFERNLPIAQARLDTMKKAAEAAALDGEPIDKDERDGHVVLLEEKFEAHDGAWNDHITGLRGDLSDERVSIKNRQSGSKTTFDLKAPDEWLVAAGEYHLHSPVGSKEDKSSFPLELDDATPKKFSVGPDGTVFGEKIEVNSLADAEKNESTRADAELVGTYMQVFDQWQQAVSKLDGEDMDFNKDDGTVLVEGLSRAAVQELGVSIVAPGQEDREDDAKTFNVQGGEASLTILTEDSKIHMAATDEGYRVESRYVEAEDDMYLTSERIDVSLEDETVELRRRTFVVNNGPI